MGGHCRLNAEKHSQSFIKLFVIFKIISYSNQNGLYNNTRSKLCGYLTYDKCTNRPGRSPGGFDYCRVHVTTSDLEQSRQNPPLGYCLHHRASIKSPRISGENDRRWYERSSNEFFAWISRVPCKYYCKLPRSCKEIQGGKRIRPKFGHCTRHKRTRNQNWLIRRG